MAHDVSLNRRRFMEMGATSVALASASGFLLGCTGQALEKPTTVAGANPTTTKISYFDKFGVSEEMIREGLAEALGHGGERADLFFQHRVLNALQLEDGEVNRAYTRVELGVGVRVVRGDQTGYAYTEDLARDAIKRAARTASAVADGPARPGPQAFSMSGGAPKRYVVEVAWSDVKPGQKMPILDGINTAMFKADGRVKKVNVAFMDEAGAILIVDSDGRMIEDI